MSASGARLRLFRIGWSFHLEVLMNSLFFVLISVLQPVIFASIAYFMFESGDPTGTLLYAALGAGMMGIWSSTLFGSGGAIQWQRWQGTLELLIGTPPPFIMTLLPLTVATATLGLYSILATLAWGWAFFGMSLAFEHPLQLAVALPVTVLSLGMMGLLLASTFVLYRNANAFACRSPSCRAGWSRSPGCSPRPGAWRRSATQRSAEEAHGRASPCAPHSESSTWPWERSVCATSSGSPERTPRSR